ncbi:nuclear fragile X mental retardation-interacting protein 2-like [Portunus trituberculatus]|uniref:nuclear fragile X mental retardation-interacting protein 2-like n=1 Tax=Portunus trituberculatus TaxID=210409 RepID=UPI001E1CE3F8|nr:nuclear fragile X mental retardation-interacting protein 2-like [Portunus trituberculatus]
MAGRSLIMMMLLTTTILGVMGESKADTRITHSNRHYPHHYPHYYPYHHHYPHHHHGDYNHHHHYYKHLYPASPYYYRYHYTQVCKYLVARPLLLARLHGLFSYYMKYCYGSIHPFPALG